MVEKFKTPQEEFWAGEFGTDYIGRNSSVQGLASNLNLFLKALKHAGLVTSCLEFGANIGINLKALQLLYPSIHLKAIEINHNAVKQLTNLVGESNVFEGSILEYPIVDKVDLSLIKGVLIHINPDILDSVYEKLYQASNRLILVCEYYSPTPISIPYRGHVDRLFKRDFAGEMLGKYPDLKLVDYGFLYRRDPAFPQDDITWFLMQKS
ncbi:MAG: pseudaminic acid biosynthesis-associated methylase [Proteobacteria bacterium]|nr:pseudaminic acid biosynthesis-associated methylase [Pseudomonadota bacterium]MBU1709853.1 pseudaminic acid biosynthesis-associated methylase [Pseudomonadota bacterium]